MKYGLGRRELLNQDAGGGAGAPNSDVPEGTSPEVVSYMDRQKTMWKEQSDALNARAQTAEARAQELDGYKRLFDAMSLDPDYSQALTGFMRGVDFKAVSGQPTQPQQAPTDDGVFDGNPIPQPPENVATKEVVENVVADKLNAFRREIAPFAEQLHRMNADREVDALKAEFGPDVTKYFQGIQTRIADAKGNLSVRDAYMLEAMDDIRAKERDRATQEGMRRAQFETVEAPSSGAQPEVGGKYQQQVDDALKRGDFRTAAQHAFRQAQEEHGGAA